MLRIFLLGCAVMCCTHLFAQTRIITGTVTDAKNKLPLTGVTVVVKGTTDGTVTDENGSYTLAVPQTNAILTYSYVGYAPVDVQVADQNEISVALNSTSKTLDDVLVVGYGIQIKRTMTGSVDKVDGDAIHDTPASTVEQTLQGKAAGVFIEANNGKVGSDIKVNIRGATSITASNQPLYVVDGIPINTTAVNDQYYVYLNPLNDINFNDIASISILKDASAAAIYGSRGANGVVIITTKRGKKGDAKIDFDYQMGFSKPTRLRDFMDADQFIDYFTAAATNAGKYKFREGIGNFATEQDAIDKSLDNLNDDFATLSGGMPLGSVNTDWQSLAFQKAFSINSDLSLSGGTDHMKYYISAGMSKQDGILIENGGNRANLLANIDVNATKKLDAGISLNLARSVNHDVPDDDQFNTPMQMVALSPITPLYDSAGNYNTDPVTLYPNPLIDATESDFNTVTIRNIANAYAEYHFNEHLSLRGEAGADLTNLTTDRFYSENTQTGKGVGGYGEAYASSAENYDTKLLLNYQQLFAGKHDVQVVGGMEYQRYNDFYAEVDATGFPSQYLKTINSAATVVYKAGSKNYNRFLSYFGRANYSYNEKYLFSGSLRYDGSSRFGQNKQYGLFPSASAGWVISQENFWKKVKPVSFLKLRLSYGITGNAEIPDFRYLGVYNATAYADQSGLYPYTLPNPDLHWESTAQTDLGLDFGLFNDRINGELDYYVKNTNDLLLDAPTASTTGFTSQYQNIGKTQNKGFEVLINADILVKKFKWSASLNYAQNKNKVVALTAGVDTIDEAGSTGMNVLIVGQPIGIFYGAQFAGADPANGDALWYINDPENPSDATTNDFNAANFVIIGDPNPKFIAGFTNSFSYKMLSLSFTLQSVYGNDVNVNGDHWMNGDAATYDNEITAALNYWKEPGDITDVPEPRYGYDNGNQYRSSRYVSDGSYLRLKTITLGFDFPKAIAQKMRMQEFQLYASAYNLFTITNYVGWDPEVSSDTFTDNTVFGLDFYSAPQPKTIVFGLKLSL